MIHIDCIYYKHSSNKQLPLLCKHSGSLYKLGERMCDTCRLWDAYVPVNSTKEEIDKAKLWLALPYEDQLKHPYEEYFKEEL